MARNYLIVDDSPVICTTLRKMLTKAGIPEDQIETVQSGDEALDLFYQLEPDVVFMDVQMPGMDGEETASMMMTEDPDVKIIVVTGMGMDDQRVKNLRSLGAFELLEKPIHSEDIDDVIRLVEREESGAGRIR